MKAYICQIGDEVDGHIAKPAYSEKLYADSLGEAIDEARAIVHNRHVHQHENTVRLMDDESDPSVVWTRPTEEVRKG